MTIDDVMKMIHDNEYMRKDDARDKIRAAIEALAAPAAPQQAEPVAQIGWADEFGNLFPMGAWKPTQRTHHDSHKAAWRAVYLHPPAAPQQAEPVAWAVFDPSGEAIYAALFKTRCVEYVDNEYRYGHGAAKHWAVRPVFAHPPAAEVQRLRDALENVRLLAARHRKEEWAGHMLRFCADAGVTGSSLREGGE